MNKVFRYLWYVLRHKLYVARECFKVALFWRGLTHDLSKLSWSEFTAYMNWFSDAEFLRAYNHDPRTAVEELWVEQRRTAFDRAWLGHQHRNSHHWQYWVLREDSGRTKVLEMPLDDALEMVCDWIGAGLAITGRRDVENWYEANKDKMLLHPNTRELVERILSKGLV